METSKETTTIKITVNGDPLEISGGVTVGELLRRLKLKPELVVVELNLDILKREQVATAALKDGDRVEVVHFVGGGARKAAAAPEPPAKKAEPPAKKAEPPARRARRSNASLVVVESPTKAKTLDRFLGSAYHVIASQGHVMDLPSSQFGVDLENDFTPKYIVIFKKRKLVKELKETAKKFKELYLATDPDREGEAISSHLAAILGNGKKVHRAVFHEITPDAVKQAFQHPRVIDVHKVEAQQARRILDRILGYSLSPLLWKKVGRGLSAGRVQSVALRLIVDREREIRVFKPEEYWEIEATLEKIHPAPKEPARFTASLDAIDGKKAHLRNEKESHQLVEELKKAPFVVSDVSTKPVQRHPAPPFITSTLQQAAFNRYGFTAARTMRVAQQLYEGVEVGAEGPVGLITYMRTDSVHLSAEAQAQARRFIGKEFGKEYLPEAPRTYKSRKGAQEAHEAIRPAGILHTPPSVKRYLTPDQAKLYSLIWDRFIASQMASARLEVTSVALAAGRCGFRASGTRVLFPGFLKIARPEEELEKPTEKSGEKEEAKPASQILPRLEKGEKVNTVKIDPSQHFTKPPPRYTEASLVRAMEELGIGRPSTYAPTLQTLSARSYVAHQGRALIPSELGETVTDLLLEHFPRVLDVKFTARMEEELDEVEEGAQRWAACVKEFYEPFADALKTAMVEMQSVKPSPQPTGEKCPQCGREIVIKWGRNGKFLSCSGFPECRFAKPITTGIKCPEPNCGGELVQRRSRRGLFYGCTRFPNCRHIENKLPQSTPPGAHEEPGPRREGGEAAGGSVR